MGQPLHRGKGRKWGRRRARGGKEGKGWEVRGRQGKVKGRGRGREEKKVKWEG